MNADPEITHYEHTQIQCRYPPKPPKSPQSIIAVSDFFFFYFGRVMRRNIYKKKGKSDKDLQVQTFKF